MLRYAVVVVICLCTVAHAGLVVVPNSLSGTEGSSNNGFPFNIADFSLSSQRYQQVYGSNQFGAGGLITQIIFRPDAFTGAAFSSTLTNVRIDLSTTTMAVDGLSTTFATNVGADDTIVFNGSLSLSSAFTGPGAGPKAFDIIITLTTPFNYNPALGNLLLDVRNFSGGHTTQFDSQGTADSISRVFTNTANTGVNTPTADVADTEGLITQFNFGAAVPEPGTWSLLLTGIAAIGIVRWRRR